MSGGILIVSLASTVGWELNERELSESLNRLGVEHRIERMKLGPSGHLRRSGVWTVVDAVEALASRRALLDGLRKGEPSAVIILSTTAALFAPVAELVGRGIPVAVRIDCPSSDSRPGPQNAIQRGLERRRLREATMAIATGPRSAELLAPLASEVRVVPVPVESPTTPAPERHGGVVTYSADPDNKGLDLVCRAWWALGERVAGRTLHVTGVEADRGRRLLLRRGVAEPTGLRWQGTLSHAEHLNLVAGADAYVSASASEGAGFAQLEALAAGTPLVTTPSLGAYEAYPLARRIVPELATAGRDGAELAVALGRALAMTDAQRRDYAAAAAREVAVYGRGEADRALREDVLPLLSWAVSR